MKKGFILGSLIFLLILTAIYLFFPIKFTGNQILSVENVTNSGYMIKIENFAYVPYQLTIKVGETITWKNFDTTKHTVTSTDDGPLNSALLGKTETYNYTFNKVGEYPYYCITHPYIKGKIIVKEF
jgi:plastocyanin